MTTEKMTLSQKKRIAIIEAAKITFTEFGVAATSMDKLAEVAKVSKRTVYNHFETKEAIVMTLMADLWERSINHNVAKYQLDVPLHQQLTDLVLTEINFINSNEYIELTRMAMGHFFYCPQEMNQELMRVKNQEGATLRWIRAAMADGKLEIKDENVALMQIHSLIKGPCFWPQVLQFSKQLTEAELHEIASEVALMFLCRYETKTS
ncbi:TetR family transcriptional regulator [Shewanella sp. 10N.286.51.B7]|uniref:TetR/AcrR family transcriptional regulator n=1 Tax=Shewanella sp. 10N.286.51.B7 TaxID=1880836 RepID=UPI000C8405F9|nr:TetR/AcrR family transcriptional regulator [Shewanella sp. 10N.286.51.B7]PMG78631.1 TetR family transcriptional regulator [Shewanella sp. 10N.286.51.B7]